MNKIEELKQKLEELKQEKIDNEKIVTEIQQNDIHIIEQELESLNTTMSKIKSAKKQVKIAKIVAHTGLAMFIFSILLLIVPIKIQQVLLPLFGNNSDMMFLICGIIAVAGLTSVISTYWSTENSKKFLMDHNYENIQSQIEEKEKQKELAKQNSKLNEQKLSTLNKRQAELDLEIKNYESKISIYEKVTSQLISEFMASSQFLENMETKVKEYNKFSIEYEDDVDIIDSQNPIPEQEINESKGNQKVKKQNFNSVK